MIHGFQETKWLIMKLALSVTRFCMNSFNVKQIKTCKLWCFLSVCVFVTWGETEWETEHNYRSEADFCEVAKTRMCNIWLTFCVWKPRMCIFFCLVEAAFLLAFVSFNDGHTCVSILPRSEWKNSFQNDFWIFKTVFLDFLKTAKIEIRGLWWTPTICSWQV